MLSGSNPHQSFNLRIAEIGFTRALSQKHTSPNFEKICQIIIEAHKELESGDSTVAVLWGIRKLKEFHNDKALIKDALNTPYRLASDLKTPGLSFVKRFFLNSPEVISVQELCGYGVDFDLQESLDIIGQVIPGNTVCHCAAFRPNLDVLMLFAEKGVDFNVKNGNGETPLDFFCEHNNFSKLQFERIFKLLLSVTDINEPRDFEETILYKAFKIRDFNSIAAVLDVYDSTPLDLIDSTYRIEDPEGSTKTVSFTGLLNEIKYLFNEFRILSEDATGVESLGNIKSEMETLVYLSRDPYHLYLYLGSFMEVLGFYPESNGKIFTSLTALVVSKFELQAITNLVSAIEDRNDYLYYKVHVDDPVDHSPHEAELMLLLSETKEDSSSKKNLDTSLLTKAITSPYRYWDFGVKKLNMLDYGWKTLSSWQRIGQLTHGFLPFKYDTETYQDQSIIENFGFRRLPENLSPEVNKFGAGFVIEGKDHPFHYRPVLDTRVEDFKEFDYQTMVVFKRGYFLVANPKYGVLVIRNSSLVFGRNLLHYPAYFYKESIKKSDLQNLEGRVIERNFVPVLKREINGVRTPFKPKAKQRSEEVMFLLDEITGLIDVYNRWKFDTSTETAFRTTKTSGLELVGAYKSPGFKHIVEYLRYKMNRGQEVPDLAFAHPYAPPWACYQYNVDAIDPMSNQKASRFEVNKFTLEFLEDLVAGKFDEFGFRMFGFLNFFQQAGIDNQASLVLLKPEK